MKITRFVSLIILLLLSIVCIIIGIVISPYLTSKDKTKNIQQIVKDNNKNSFNKTKQIDIVQKPKKEILENENKIINNDYVINNKDGKDKKEDENFNCKNDVKDNCQKSKNEIANLTNIPLINNNVNAKATNDIVVNISLIRDNKEEIAKKKNESTKQNAVAQQQKNKKVNQKKEKKKSQKKAVNSKKEVKKPEVKKEETKKPINKQKVETPKQEKNIIESQNNNDIDTYNDIPEEKIVYNTIVIDGDESGFNLTDSNIEEI